MNLRLITGVFFAALSCAALFSCGDDNPVKNPVLTYDTLDIPDGVENTYIRIVRVLANPATEEKNEGFELAFYGEDSLNLENWSIRDGSGAVWSLSAYDFIKFKDTITVMSDKNKAELPNGGDTIELMNPQGDVVQSFVYEEAENGVWIESLVFDTVLITYEDGKGVKWQYFTIPDIVD